MPIFRLCAVCLVFACGCSDTERKQSPTVATSAPDAPTPKTISRIANADGLINSLRDLDSVAVGLHPTSFATAFLASDDDPQFSGGVLGSLAPQANPAMQRLVQLGVDAIPALIAHLDDKRPTQLAVGSQVPIMSKWFDEEYDPRKRVKADASDIDLDLDFKNTFERSFNDDYVVKVGDVCFVLIGQIVNRNLIAVRYQPSGCMVVNSPIESPDLADRLKRDWETLTKQQHIDSLTADLENAEGAWDGMPALARLRYYYPEALANLRKGKLQRRITEIEASSCE